jgi:hypothetical protein
VETLTYSRLAGPRARRRGRAERPLETGTGPASLKYNTREGALSLLVSALNCAKGVDGQFVHGCPQSSTRPPGRRQTPDGTRSSRARQIASLPGRCGRPGHEAGGSHISVVTMGANTARGMATSLPLVCAACMATARRAGAPCLRPIPRSVSRIAGCLVSSGCPATPQARAIAATRRRSPIRLRHGAIPFPSTVAVRRKPPASTVESAVSRRRSCPSWAA